MVTIETPKTGMYTLWGLEFFDMTDTDWLFEVYKKPPPHPYCIYNLPTGDTSAKRTQECGPEGVHMRQVELI